MKRAYRLYLFALLLQLILAFVCAPHSCQWGNGVYFALGIITLLFSFVLPFFQKEWPQSKRLLLAFLFLLGSVVIWCVGFMLADFQIMCRLF